MRLRKRDLLFIPVFAAISVGLYYINVYVNLIIPICWLIIDIIAFWIRFRRTVFETVTLSVIALGLTVFLMIISTVIALILGLALTPFINDTIHDVINDVIISLALAASTILLFKIKRFRNGIVLYRKDSTFERLILASVICISVLTLFYSSDANNTNLRRIFIIIVVFCGFSFIIWWKKLSSSNYDAQLQKHNLETLERNLVDLAGERDKLLKQNEEMAKIIHRDNKMLPTMEYAVNDICKKYGAGKDATEVLESLQKLQAERATAIAGYESAGERHLTGNVTVDAAFAFLQGKAQKQNCEFTLAIDKEAAASLIERFGEVTEFNTLVCDLAENALIAVRGENGKVKIETGFDENAPCIKFFDNGKPFDEKVFFEMGRTKITTHKHEGGNGIGLISTFEILRGYGFSLIINENVADTSFTKCVEIVADGKCLHRVLTERQSVKRICAEREDFFKD